MPGVHSWDVYGILAGNEPVTGVGSTCTGKNISSVVFSVFRTYVLLVAVLVVMGLFLLVPGTARAAEPTRIPTEAASVHDACKACREVLSEVRAQRRDFRRELRQVKREVAFMREAMTRPSLKDVFGGIGYILGIFGIVFYVQGRRRAATNRRRE